MGAQVPGRVPWFGWQEPDGGMEGTDGGGGVTVRLVFQVGEPPKATPRENLQNLLKFGSQFDNIEIK